jgi:N-carbamoylputrescine amidase
MSQWINLAVVQQSHQDSREAYWQESIKGIAQAAEQGAQLVLLQELHAGSYFCQTQDSNLFQWAETIPGPLSSALANLAKQYQVIIVGSVFEQRAPGLYHNTAIVLEKDGRLVGRYRKMHIPDDPGYYEKYYFTPGDLGFEPVQTSLGKLGVLICWDQWYPEAARIMALRGADLLLYPSAIGWTFEDSEQQRKRLVNRWLTIQRSHAIANGLPVVCCNRVGFEADLSGVTKGAVFWGNSFITDAYGQLLQEASQDKAEVLMTRVDLHETARVRHEWPFLRDRRIDAYQDLLKLHAF